MSDMFETIGKVRLDKRWYQGNDSYSDGDEAENRLLHIVENHAGDDYNDIAMHESSWPLLYHLSPIRENIISWYPFRKGAKVLELGAGCGAVTGALLNRGLQVTAVDLSLRRCRINATRHADCEELTICVGSIEEVLKNINQSFDYVLLIGVLEYAAVFSDANNPQAYMLNSIKRIMKPDTELFVAIENRIGLKYFAGCREDHTGRYFESIEGYPHHDGPVTLCKRQLQELFDACGFSCDFYYPYPDYKFPMKVFSDWYLPAKGEMNRNWQHFDANRVCLFNEDLANDVMIDAGLVTELSNSFLVKLTLPEKKAGDRVVFVKSSMERRPAYRHHTLIIERENGERVVRKKAATPSAKEHLRHMRDCYDQLVDSLKPGASIGIVPCKLNEDGTIDFDYCVQGTLRDRLADMRGDVSAFCDAISHFRAALIASFGTVAFQKTEAFRAVFGDVALEEDAQALKVTNLDLNFDNVFIDNGSYIIADYEWVMPFSVPLSFILYRALLVNVDMLCFNDEQRELIWKSLGIDSSMQKVYYEMELGFQRFVSGENDKLERFKNAAFENDYSSLNLDELLLVEEYHRVNDALWERVTVAEKALADTVAELRIWKRRAPIWHKIAYWLKTRKSRR